MGIFSDRFKFDLQSNTKQKKQWRALDGGGEQGRVEGFKYKYDGNRKYVCDRIAAVLYNKQLAHKQMTTSFFRMVGGYSRFALQEERKHQNVLGSLFQTNAYRAFYQHGEQMEGKLMPSQASPGFPRLHIPNLLSNPLIQAFNSAIKQLRAEQKQQNETNTIQYQANNGIEDRLVTGILKSIGAETMSVFDGHGGDKLADYCAQHIVDLIDGFVMENISSKKYESDTDNLIIDALKYAYDRLQQDFYQNVYIPQAALNNRKVKNVGTCALTVVIYGQKVYVANSGDSEAILVSESADRKIGFTELNERLSVNNAAERERLMREFPEDSDIVVEEGNGSYYVKGRLQPTRSIGDYHLKYSHLYKGKGKFNGPYVTSEPQVKVFELKSEHKAIVVGSDGVWDFADKQSIAEASLKPNPQEQILELTLQKIAGIHNKSIDEIKQVEAGQKRAFHDDISVGVISLGSLSKPENSKP